MNLSSFAENFEKFQQRIRRLTQAEREDIELLNSAATTLQEALNLKPPLEISNKLLLAQTTIGGVKVRQETELRALEDLLPRD